MEQLPIIDNHEHTAHCRYEFVPSTYKVDGVVKPVFWSRNIWREGNGVEPRQTRHLVRGQRVREEG